MNAIHQCLDSLAGAKLATVVHVNATDPELIDRYLALGARRVALAVADPDAVAPMRRAAGSRAGVEVVEAVVSPNAGAASWLRFNVREVSGLLEPSGLRTFYPRLQLIERVPVATSALQPLLDGLKLEPGHNLLVLEAPGMEAALLERLSAATLRCFEWVLLRGAKEGLYEGASAHEAAPRWLQARFFKPARELHDADPLWPVTLMRHDPAAAERAALAGRVKELEAQLERELRDRDARIEQLTKARDEQVQAKAQAEKLAQERLAQVEQLTKTRDEKSKLVDERDKQLQALTAAKAQADKLAQDRQALIEQLTKARDENVKLATERQKRVTQLDAELTDISARYAMLQEELVKAEAHVELISDLVLRETVR